MEANGRIWKRNLQDLARWITCSRENTTAMKIARPRWRDLKRRDKNATGGTSVNPRKSLGRKGRNESNRNTRECQPCISLNRQYRPCSWNRFYGGPIDGRIVRHEEKILPNESPRFYTVPGWCIERRSRLLYEVQFNATSLKSVQNVWTRVLISN